MAHPTERPPQLSRRARNRCLSSIVIGLLPRVTDHMSFLPGPSRSVANYRRGRGLRRLRRLPRTTSRRRRTTRRCVDRRAADDNLNADGVPAQVYNRVAEILDTAADKGYDGMFPPASATRVCQYSFLSRRLIWSRHRPACVACVGNV